jgi:hypothetical protein
METRTQLYRNRPYRKKHCQRSLAQLNNDETQGIFKTVLDCTILMSNGPIVNQLLLKKSIAQLKFE